MHIADQKSRAEAQVKTKNTLETRKNFLRRCSFVTRVVPSNNVETVKQSREQLCTP